MTNQDLYPWIEPEIWTHIKKHLVLLFPLCNIGWAENDTIRDGVKETLA
jgi:hypothetical protein